MEEKNSSLIEHGTLAVQNYQKMLNSKHGANLKEDGAWGPLTQAAYEQSLKEKVVNKEPVPVTKKSTPTITKPTIPQKPDSHAVLQGPKSSGTRPFGWEYGREKTIVSDNVTAGSTKGTLFTGFNTGTKQFILPNTNLDKIPPNLIKAEAPVKTSSNTSFNIQVAKPLVKNITSSNDIPRTTIAKPAPKPILNTSVKPSIKAFVKQKPDGTESRITEFFNSVANEGIGNAAEQAYNYIRNKLTPTKTDVVLKSKPLQSLPKMEGATMQSLGDTIKRGNRFYTPLKIDVDRENKFGFRNRGDNKDLENVDGIVFNTFFPFQEKAKYNTEEYKDYDVIGINNDTGKLQVGGQELLKSNNTHFAPVHKPNRVKDINFSNPTKDKNLNNRSQINFVTNDNSVLPNNRVMLGDKNNPNALVDNYAGGKLLLSTPDNKQVELIYGTAEEIKKQFYAFKSKHKLSFVNIYSGDGKAFSQTYQTLNKKISGKELNAFDNTNSSGGNSIYVKSKLAKKTNKNYMNDTKLASLSNKTKNKS